MKPSVEELQTANEDLLTLLLQFNAVSELMGRSSMPVNKDRILESIVVGVRSELSFDRVAIWRYEPISQSFIGTASVGLPAELVRALRFPLQACLPLVKHALNEGRVLRQDRAVMAPLLQTLYESLGEPVKPGLVVPLLSRGKDRCWRVRRIPEGCAKAEAGPEKGALLLLDADHVLTSCLPCPVFPVEGFLWVDNAKSGRPLHEDLLPLGLFLRHTDLILENAVLYEELSKISIKDALTGVYNRAYFNYLLQVEAERCLRYGHAAAVLFVDVHGMRRINDSAGQVAGDRLLTVLGELLRRRLRRIDFVARYGGDEFALLLPHTDGERALRVAHRLQKLIAEHPFGLPSCSEPVQICMGMAIVPESAVDTDALIALADFALHEAQVKGPGSVVKTGDAKTMEVT